MNIEFNDAMKNQQRDREQKVVRKRRKLKHYINDPVEAEKIDLEEEENKWREFIDTKSNSGFSVASSYSMPSMNLAIYSIIKHSLEKEFLRNDSPMLLFNAMFYTGGLIGMILCLLMRVFERPRKPIILLSVLCSLFSWLVMISTTEDLSLAISRCIAGMSTSIHLLSAYYYIYESPLNKVCKKVVRYEALLEERFGFLSIFLSGLLLPWRYVACVGILLHLRTIYKLISIRESPYILQRNGDDDLAKETFKSLSIIIGDVTKNINYVTMKDQVTEARLNENHPLAYFDKPQLILSIMFCSHQLTWSQLISSLSIFSRDVTLINVIILLIAVYFLYYTVKLYSRQYENFINDKYDASSTFIRSLFKGLIIIFIIGFVFIFKHTYGLTVITSNILQVQYCYYYFITM